MAQAFVTAGIEAEAAERQLEEARRQKELDDAHRLAESEKRRAEEQARSAARLRRRAIFLAGALVLALAAALAAVFFGVQSQRQTQIARSRLLAVQAETAYEDQPLLGLRLLLEAWPIAPDDERGAIESSIRDKVIQGRLVKLGQDVEGVYSNEHVPYLIFDRTGTAGEVRRADTGQVSTTLSGPIKDWGTKFSSRGTYVVVSYDALPAELRRTDTWQAVALSGIGGAGEVSFCPDESHVSVTYLDAPSEIRRTDSGALISKMVITDTTYSDALPHFDASCRRFYTCRMIDAVKQCELYEVSSGHSVPLTDVAQDIRFSPKGTFTVVDYGKRVMLSFEMQEPDEIRLTETNEVVERFDNLVNVVFSPDESYWIVWESGKSSRLQWADRSPDVPLTVEAYSLKISPDSSYFVIGSYPDASRLYQINTKQWIDLLDRPAGVEFSPDGRFVVLGASNNGLQHVEVYEVKTGRRFGFDRKYNYNTISFSPDQSYFVVTFQGPNPAELWRTEDGQILSLFDRPLSGGDFSADSTYLMAQFRDGSYELWNVRKGTRLARLGLGLGSGAIGWGEDTGYHFDLDNQRLITWHTSGLTYLLDLAWLESMANVSTSDDLIRVACWPFKSTHFFDETALQPYLEQDSPRACR